MRLQAILSFFISAACLIMGFFMAWAHGKHGPISLQKTLTQTVVFGRFRVGELSFIWLGILKKI